MLAFWFPLIIVSGVAPEDIINFPPASLLPTIRSEFKHDEAFDTIVLQFESGVEIPTEFHEKITAVEQSFPDSTVL